MATKLLSKAGTKLFEKHLEQYAPVDPYYETWTDDRGKQRRKKRELPPGLSKRDAKILKSVKRRAHYLDKGFTLCGFQFGWTFFIGIIPGAGDAVNVILNYMLVVRKARKAELPGWLVRHMLLNNAVSAGVGIVPIVGDVALAAWKTNSRNAALLEEFLRIRGEELIKIEAAGKDPDAVVAAGSAAASGPSKGKGKPVAKGVTEADAAQVKPGAGKVAGETIKEPTDSTQPSPSSSAMLSAGKGKKSTRRSFSSWIRPKAPAGEKGRFVEDVEPKVNTRQA